MTMLAIACGARCVNFALVAQLAERTAVNRKVLGSNPSRSVDGPKN